MNWMSVVCFLLGLAVGIEIAYLVMKYRYDTVAKEMTATRERIGELLETNARIIGKWNETINTNGRIIDLNRKLLEELEKRI